MLHTTHYTVYTVHSVSISKEGVKDRFTQELQQEDVGDSTGGEGQGGGELISDEMVTERFFNPCAFSYTWPWSNVQCVHPFSSVGGINPLGRSQGLILLWMHFVALFCSSNKIYSCCLSASI